MEFRFETDYNKKALTEMAKAARKTSATGWSNY